MPLTAPSTGTEDLLIDLWCQAMGPKARLTSGQILEASFGFQRLLRFLDLIETSLGVKVSAPVLMQVGTLEALAQAIDSNTWPEPSSMVMLRDGDESEILLLVSAASGVVLELCDLAQVIDFPGRIYGLQPPGLGGETEPLASIREIANCYRAEISRKIPSSKVHIVGYSFGGMVTLELVKMLKRDGHPLGLVGLLDSSVYEKYWPKIESLKMAGKRVKRKLIEMKKKPSPLDALHFFAHCTRIAASYLQRRIKGFDEAKDPIKSAYYIGSLEPNFQRVRNAIIVAGQSYIPSFYDGKIVLFKSKLGDPNACDPVAIWKRQVAALTVIPVPGSHATMIRKPHVETLASEISRCLVVEAY